MENIKYLQKLIFNIKLLIITFYIFFFDLGINELIIFDYKFNYIDVRIIFIFLLPILIYELFNNKNSWKIKTYSIILLTILLHFLINSQINNFDLTKFENIKFSLSLIFLILIIHNLDFFIKNLIKIIEIFLLTYFILNIIFLFTIMNNDYSCIFGCYSKTRLLYKEASHLSYVAPFILFFYLFKVDFKKLNLFKKFYSIFFNKYSMNLSTTLLLSTLLTAFCFLILYFKLLNYKQKIYLLVVFLVSVTVFVFHKSTYTKAFYIYNFNERLLSVFLSERQILYLKKKIGSENKNIDHSKIREEKKEILKKKKIIHNPHKTNNLSVDVLYANTKLAFYSFKKNIFGNGLHNYEKVHQKYITTVNDSTTKGTMWLNRTNGSNNLNKGLVEFGIFFLIFLIIFFYFIFSKKIMKNDLQTKCLIISILCTQIFIRGSGFFTGSFLFLTFIVFREIFKKKVDLKINK